MADDDQLPLDPELQAPDTPPDDDQVAKAKAELLKLAIPTPQQVPDPNAQTFQTPGVAPTPVRLARVVAATPEEAQPIQAPSPQALPQFLMDQAKRFEGFRTRAYPDVNHYSIGYGTYARSPNEVVTQSEAERRLADELTKAAAIVDKQNPNLSEGARNALIDLTFNAGGKWTQQTLGNLVRAGNMDAAKQELLAYNKSGGVPNAVLKSRRAQEATWFGGDQTPHAEQVMAMQTSADPGELAPYLDRDKDKSHITGMLPEFRGRLATMLQNAPPEIRNQLTINSGYRSPERQAQLYAQAVAKYGAGGARKWVAPPGHSEHNRGDAADLGFGSDAARQWVHANAAKYGLKFPMGHEPWHIEASETRGGPAFKTGLGDIPPEALSPRAAAYQRVKLTGGVTHTPGEQAQMATLYNPEKVAELKGLVADQQDALVRAAGDPSLADQPLPTAFITPQTQQTLGNLATTTQEAPLTYPMAYEPTQGQQAQDQIRYNPTVASTAAAYMATQPPDDNPYGGVSPTKALDFGSRLMTAPIQTAAQTWTDALHGVMDYFQTHSLADARDAVKSADIGLTKGIIRGIPKQANNFILGPIASGLAVGHVATGSETLANASEYLTDTAMPAIANWGENQADQYLRSQGIDPMAANPAIANIGDLVGQSLSPAGPAKMAGKLAFNTLGQIYGPSVMDWMLIHNPGVVPDLLSSPAHAAEAAKLGIDPSKPWAAPIDENTSVVQTAGGPAAIRHASIQALGWLVLFTLGVMVGAPNFVYLPAE